MSTGTSPPRLLLLFRGQGRGAPVGSWWSSDRDDALSFARSRGGWEYEVLTVEVPADWAKAFHQFERGSGDVTWDWYKIPPERLAEHAMAVTGEVRVTLPVRSREQLYTRLVFLLNYAREHGEPLSASSGVLLDDPTAFAAHHKLDLNAPRCGHHSSPLEEPKRRPPSVPFEGALCRDCFPEAFVLPQPPPGYRRCPECAGSLVQHHSNSPPCGEPCDRCEVGWDPPVGASRPRWCAAVDATLLDCLRISTEQLNELHRIVNAAAPELFLAEVVK